MKLGKMFVYKRFLAWHALNSGQKIISFWRSILCSLLSDPEVIWFCHFPPVAYICGKCLCVSVHVLGTYLMLLLRQSDHLKQGNFFCRKSTLRSFLLDVVCDHSEITSDTAYLFKAMKLERNWLVLFQFL